MKVAWNQLNDMGQPVLANWGDHVNRNFIFNVLSVPVVGDSASVDASRVRILGVHHSVVFLRLVSRLDIGLLCNVKFGTGLIHILIANDSCLNVNVETLTTWSVVSSDFVGDREVVSLT